MLRSGIAGLCGKRMLNFQSKCPFIVKVSFYILTSNIWEFQLPCILSALYIVSGFNYSHSGVCVCVLPSHCHFCLYLPNDSNDKWRQASYVLIVYLYTFLVKCLFKYVKNGIFLLLLSWGSCLYILDTNPFSESCVLVACLFIL